MAKKHKSHKSSSSSGKHKKHRSSRRSARRLRRYLRRMRKGNKGAVPSEGAAVPKGAIPGAGGWVNDAVPDSSTLLAYKLLKDSVGDGNSAVFQDMLENELKFLIGGITILKNDAKISSSMGGETMANAATLAQILKNKTKELDMNDRIEQVASDILYHDYARPGKLGLAPGRINPTLVENTATGQKLHYRMAGSTGYGWEINTDNLVAGGGLPAIAPRAANVRGAGRDANAVVARAAGTSILF